MRLLRDFSVSTVVAGFVTTLVGLTSSIAIVFSGAKALGANDAKITSWVWAICVGMAVLSTVPSWRLRMPVMIAYSTPGAVLLSTLKPGDFTMAQGVGAFLICAVAITLVGFSGLFEKMMDRIPVALASALLAGALTRFAVKGFEDAKTAPWLILAATFVYVVVRRVAPRYAVVAVLVTGVLVAVATRKFAAENLQFSIAKPVFTGPEFTLSAFVSIAIPLFIVTMAGQNLPGVAAIRNAKFDIPISKVIGASGVGSFVLAPFGAYALNLSAITAAICMEPASHEDPSRRYTAAMASGGFYFVTGIFGTSVVGALNAFPPELVHIIAALALLPTIGANLMNAVRDESQRDAALITFLVVVSGVTVAKVGAAFWGAIAGVLASLILTYARRSKGNVAPTAPSDETK